MNRPKANTFTLETSLTLNRPIEGVFLFFADAHNLQAITPPWLNFEIVNPEAIVMQQGQMIDYRLRLRGVPIQWRSEITAWEPPYRFVDEQRRGPYLLWIHEHIFERRGEQTDIIDRVTYRVPGGALINSLIVRPDLDRIFAYRQKMVRQYIEQGAPIPGNKPVAAAV